MKDFTCPRIAAVALSAVVLALLSISAASAATNPLNQPRGLAVASNGNLYVANQGGNNVLVFNPNYAFVSSKTITAGISKPSGVAFDPQGNLYVSNLGDGEVTEYSSTGAQITAATISGIVSPEAIAVDGIYNIYVDSSYTNIAIYSANGIPHTQTPSLVENLTPSGDAFCIAARSQYFSYGSVQYIAAVPLDSALRGNPVGNGIGANEVLACGFDANNGIYYGDTANYLDYFSIPNGSAVPVASLGFTAEGIAVDTTRGRIYVSNQQGNSIAVYNTSGTLLKTIQ